MSEHVSMPIASDLDLVAARQAGRQMAEELGFCVSDRTVIAAAISEIVRNILEYAGSGSVDIQMVNGQGRRGIRITATDYGPGIPDISLAMQDGYSTAGGLGVGLPGARRLMDEFDVQSAKGHGTKVIMSKWVM